MKSVIRPLVIAPSIAPMVTKEPNKENCHSPEKNNNDNDNNNNNN